MSRPCRSFRSDEGDNGFGEKMKREENFGEEIEISNDFDSRKKVDNVFVNAVRKAVWRVSKPSLRSQGEFREAIEKLEETLFSVSLLFFMWNFENLKQN